MAETSDRAPAENAETAAPAVSDAVLTVPNVITFVRLALIPIFLFLVFADYDLAAGSLLAFIAATDFLDGKIARRYGQVSRLGTMLDPVADRVLILAAAIGVIVRGDIMPLWLILILVVREVLTASWVLWLKARGVQLVVRFVGKVQATLVFASIPCFIWASGLLHPRSGTPSDAFTIADDVFTAAGYVFAISGAVLGYTTFGLYLHDGVQALRRGHTPGARTIEELT